MSDWINAEDRKPEYGDLCLVVYHYYTKPIVTIATWRDGFISQGMGLLMRDIKYWQPLPPPPEIEDA